LKEYICAGAKNLNEVDYKVALNRLYRGIMNEVNAKRANQKGDKIRKTVVALTLTDVQLLLAYLNNGFEISFEGNGTDYYALASLGGQLLGSACGITWNNSFTDLGFDNATQSGEGDFFAEAVQTTSLIANILDIMISIGEQTIQSTRLGANFAYAISGSSKLVNVLSNTIKYAPYVGLFVTVGTGYYLSTDNNPATGRPYQSWGVTGTDIGVNIATMYIGTQYGGWYGAGAAAFYIGVKTNVQYQMDYGINPGMIFIMNKE